MVNLRGRLSGGLFCLLVSAASLSCSSDDFGCIFFFQVEIDAIRLPVGVVGDEYDGLIETEISNEPNDNDYDFFFSVDSGSLPPELELEKRGNQLVGFAGVLTETGIFDFKIKVKARHRRGSDDDDFAADICETLTGTRRFSITVTDDE